MNRISEVMKERGLTQDEVAAKTELTQQNISSICRNASQPSLPTLFKIAAALGVKPAKLIGDGSEIED